jgi:hypothetical protein
MASTLPRLPKIVNNWFKQFISEGEDPRTALAHAIQRGYESGVSKKTADRLEANMGDILEARADFIHYNPEEKGKV